MTRLKDLKKRLMKDPEFREEYVRADDEFTLIEALVRARTAAKLTQAELARRLGTTQSAIARLEGGGVSPSFTTLRRYAEATHTRLTVDLVQSDRAGGPGDPESPPEATIATVSDFLECIRKFGAADQGQDLYRGQGDARWDVDCSAVRRLTADRSTAIARTLIGHALIGYLDNLLRNATKYVGTCPELPAGCSELDLLAQLQHQGAATGLIDFTLDARVALWFACREHPHLDGAVYILSRADVQEIGESEIRQNGLMRYFIEAGVADWSAPPYLWRPRVGHGRPASQQSVFVLGVPMVQPALLYKVVIGKAAKQALLTELQTDHDITEDNLFADLSGYAHANSAGKPLATASIIAESWIERVSRNAESADSAQAHVDCGLAYDAIGQHEYAIDRYTRAITIDSGNIGAYVNRATSRRRLGDNEGSLADYNVAIQRCESGADDVDAQKAARVYWSRGQTYEALGLEEQACADMNKAIQLGLELWINVEDKDEPGIQLSPDTGRYRNEEDLIPSIREHRAKKRRS